MGVLVQSESSCFFFAIYDDCSGTFLLFMLSQQVPGTFI